MKKPDHFFIEELCIETIIGTHPHERNSKQPILLDIDVYTDLKKALLSDNIQDTINYDDIIECVIDFVKSSSFQLIETLADKIAQLILSKFNVDKIIIRLRKPRATLKAQCVGIVIERSNP